MDYRFQKDIVYTKVCGVSILVTLQDSWDIFPAVKQLSPIEGCFCQGIEQKMSEDELIEAIRLPKATNKDGIRKRYHRFLEEMTEQGYLIPEDEHDGS